MIVILNEMIRVGSSWVQWKHSSGKQNFSCRLTEKPHTVWFRDPEEFPALFPPVQSTRNVSKMEKKRGKRREKGGKVGKSGEMKQFVKVLRILPGKRVFDVKF